VAFIPDIPSSRVLLCHLPPMEPSADDRLSPDASVRRNATAKQMTPFGVLEGWFDARLASLVARIGILDRTGTALRC
jgi:hypothetical protein